jgi:hypothetical protein
MFGIKEYLATFTASEMTDRIRNFRGKNFRKMNKGDVHQALLDVLLGGQEYLSMPVYMGAYPAGTEFFRIRQPIKSGTAVPMDCALVEADAWEPPSQYARASRLNLDGEALLYTTPGNLLLPMDEAKLPHGAPAAMFVYRADRRIKVNVIGSRFEDHPSLTEEERHKLNQVADFLQDEFTRDVGAGTEHLYLLSETIAKDWYDMPPRDVQDAWCYPSVASKSGFNVCFRPEIAHECLELRGALIGTRENDNFRVKMVAVVENGQFAYHAVGSEVQRGVFPQVVSA